MTFRIDKISLDQTVAGRWTCAFKGFRGQGVYGRAELDGSRSELLLESTMDSKEQLVVTVVVVPSTSNCAEMRAWFGEQLEALGWGPEVDQLNELLQPRPVPPRDLWAGAPNLSDA